MDKLWTPEQVAKELQVEPSTVKRWLRQGKLQGVKPGKEWRVHEEQLSAFLFDEFPLIKKKELDHSLRHFYNYIDKLKHAIKYALNAIEEHEAGSSIDWQDVTTVLKRAIEEQDNAGQ